MRLWLSMRCALLVLHGGTLPATPRLCWLHACAARARLRSVHRCCRHMRARHDCTHLLLTPQRAAAALQPTNRLVR